MKRVAESNVAARARRVAVSGEGLRHDTKARRAGGYVASVESLAIAEGALIIESGELSEARARLQAADDRMVASAEAWLEASAERFQAAKMVRRLLMQARRHLERPTTNTGRLMGDPAPGRTPWA